jgi:hypothetical protein
MSKLKEEYNIVDNTNQHEEEDMSVLWKDKTCGEGMLQEER